VLKQEQIRAPRVKETTKTPPGLKQEQIKQEQITKPTTAQQKADKNTRN
jgi:hypothetical protein